MASQLAFTLTPWRLHKQHRCAPKFTTSTWSRDERLKHSCEQYIQTLLKRQSPQVSFIGRISAKLKVFRR